MLTSGRYLSRAITLVAIVALGCGCGATTSTSSTLPTVVLGDKGSAEQLLLGELYAQALRAQGYVVVLKPGIGDTEQMNTAIQSGRIDAYPEDLGALASTVAGHTAPIASESEVEQIAQQYEQFHGVTVMMPVTPFSDAGVAVTLTSFAKQRNLTTIEHLGALPFRLKFGGDAAAETQYGGFGGFQQAYGLTNLQFVPLAAGTSIYDALDSHLVQVGDGLSTDPQLMLGTYSVLSDPKGIFGFHHLSLVVRASLLVRLGPQFRQVYSSVTRLLTPSAMQTLNRSVVLDGQMPASVAHSFLLANHLVSS